MIYVFTSCALNYFPNAKILARSLRKNLPAAHTVFCLTDVEPTGFDARSEGFDEYWTLEDLRSQIPNLEQWIFQHDVMELATAVKPFILHRLLERDDCDGVLFFDPDCELYSSCQEILDSVQRNSITLTPHTCIPHTADDWIFFELNQLKVGTFNLGFFGVKNDDEGRSFARWWRHRLRSYCVVDEPRHLFTDQKWIDLVPSYFTSFNVLRRPTYNLARWNSFQRTVIYSEDGGILVDGLPLDFIHYSGFLKIGSYVRGLYDEKSAPWCKDIDVLDDLSRKYAQRLEADQKRPELSAEWGFARYSDEELIHSSHRMAFRQRPQLMVDYQDPFSGGERLRKRIEGADHSSPNTAPQKSPVTETVKRKNSFLRKLFKAIF